LFDRRPGRGLAGYIQVTCRELLTYKPADYTISGDVGLSTRALLIAVANSTQFGNGARLAPAARVDDGRLDLVVVRERSRLTTICALPRLFTGGAAHAPGVLTEKVAAIAVESAVPMAFHVDGEPVAGGTRLEARVHPGALRVCVR
jgi:diacylglycerol kinase family enzyme